MKKNVISFCLMFFISICNSIAQEQVKNDSGEQLKLSKSTTQQPTFQNNFQSITPNATPQKEEKNLWDKFWALGAGEKKFSAGILFVIAVVLWGFFRFVFTGKQFGKDEYTVLDKIKLGENTFAETRKNNNSGLVFYFTYGPIEKKYRGRIEKEAYEELKLKVKA